MVSFYRHFIHNFSTIMAPIMGCIKEGKFSWSTETTIAFEVIKEKLNTSPLLALMDFSQPFELHYDASKVRIGVMLIQSGNLVAYFRVKLSGSKLNYSTYDVEFYVLVQALKHWSSY